MPQCVLCLRLIGEEVSCQQLSAIVVFCWFVFVVCLCSLWSGLLCSGSFVLFLCVFARLLMFVCLVCGFVCCVFTYINILFFESAL